MPKSIKRTPVAHPDIDRLPPHAAQFRLLREVKGVTQAALQKALEDAYDEERDERIQRPSRGWISNLERGHVSVELLEKFPERLDRIAAVLSMTPAELRWALGVPSDKDVESMRADLEAGPPSPPFGLRQQDIAGRAWMLMQAPRAVYRLGRPRLHDTTMHDLDAGDVEALFASRDPAPDDHILVFIHDQAMQDAQGRGLRPGDIVTVRLLADGEQVRDGRVYIFEHVKKGGRDHVARRARVDRDQVWAVADHPDALTYRAIRVVDPKVRAVGEVILVTRTTPVHVGAAM